MCLGWQSCLKILSIKSLAHRNWRRPVQIYLTAAMISLCLCFFFVLRSNPLLIARATRKLSAHCGHVILDTTPLIDVQAHNNNYDFDAPDSIDIELLCSTLRKLKEGQRIKVPIYDFGTHSRSPETEEMYVL